MSGIRISFSLLLTFICLWSNFVPLVSAAATLSVEQSVVSQDFSSPSEEDQEEGEWVEEVCLEDALPTAPLSWFPLESNLSHPPYLAVGAFADRSVETPPPKI